MLDYWKLWIHDKNLIETTLQKIQNHETVSNDAGELIEISGNIGQWQIKRRYDKPLQITGSIHKYWNKGTNENDFPFPAVKKAILKFCNYLQLPPEKLFVVNLEFGINLQLVINASIVLDQVICFNNLQPIRPYQKQPNCYFIEFEQWDYYLKIYDKGKQYSNILPGTPNTLRLEIKGMNSRYLQKLGIYTVADLLNIGHLQVLALKIEKTLKRLVLDDDTLNPKELPLKERRLYQEWRNPRKWKAAKGATSSTQRNIARKFKAIVEQHGQRKIYSTLDQAVKTKILQLSQNPKLAFFLPNLYVEKQ